jgi:hypothetical protein
VTSLYAWLKFLHLVGLAVFLFGHGISAGSAIALRGRPGAAVGAVQRFSIRSYVAPYAGLLLLVGTGVWMAFLGAFWRSGWIWTSIAIMVAMFAVIAAVARRRPSVVGWAGGIGLLALIFLMVFKPF